MANFLIEHGEKALRFLNGVREIVTSKEKEYLIPIFQDVYTDARQIDPKLSQDINIYISDEMSINAYAVGRTTVAVTKGAMETMSDQELKGFIAHELGHISNGDTMRLLLAMLGSAIFGIFVLITRVSVAVFESMGDSRNFMYQIVKFFAGLFIAESIFLCQALMAMGSRKAELKADKFAFKIGYGAELLDGLYLLNDLDVSSTQSPIDRLRATHPHTSKRIAQLEELLNSEQEQETELILLPPEKSL